MEEYTVYLLFSANHRSLCRRIFSRYELSSFTDEVLVDICDESESGQEQISEWVTIRDINDFIRLGENGGSRYASIYYSCSGTVFTAVTFTLAYDGTLIAGFFIPVDSVSDQELEKTALSLKNEYMPEALSIFVEEPPPSSKDDFLAKSEERALYRLP